MMKRLFFLVLLFAATHPVMAQTTSWTLKIGKISKSFSADYQRKNTLSITSLELSKKGDLLIGYKPSADEKEWKRTLLINDSTGTGIIELPELVKTKKNSSGIWFTIPNKKLKEVLSKHGKILIDCASIPSDPEKAALVRMRPLPVCAVVLR